MLDKSIVLDIKEIEEYTFPLDEPFSLRVFKNGVKYEFIIKFASENKNLICFGSGAWARNIIKNGKIIKPPYFDRWSWFNYFNESVLTYTDPTFHYDENITLGWYVGGEEWFLEVISEIIQKIAINQEISNNNILFFGSSGGGFSSIGLATLIKDSKALVNNSLFSIFDLSESHCKNLLKFLKKELKINNEDEILKKIHYRIDLIELFKKMNYVPDITYYVNLCSKDDKNLRCIPFTKKLINLDIFNSNFSVHFYHDDIENPHSPLDISETLNILHLFIRSHLYDKKRNEFNIEDFVK